MALEQLEGVILRFSSDAAVIAAYDEHDADPYRLVSAALPALCAQMYDH